MATPVRLVDEVTLLHGQPPGGRATGALHVGVLAHAYHRSDVSALQHVEIVPRVVRPVDQHLGDAAVQSLRGLLFIFFVALLLRVRLLNRAREAGQLARRSVDDILFELSKIRAVSTGGRWMLTEVPKNARTALEKMGVPVGVSTQL